MKLVPRGDNVIEAVMLSHCVLTRVGSRKELYSVRAANGNQLRDVNR
jgi:hypothetical protein